MKFIERVTTFLGNFSPLFLIVYITYYGLSFNIFLLPITATFLCNLIWLQLLSRRRLDDSHTQFFEVMSARDIGPQVIAYFLSYALSLPSVVVVGGSRGIIILAILMILIFTLSHSSRIMLYNPFLSVVGFRIYEIMPRAGPHAYILSNGQPLVADQKVTAAQIEDYIYVVKKSRKHGKKNSGASS